jgi:DNA-directed RNA polymerase specialized sigma24 family protein
MSDSKGITPLDDHLYAWLSETQEQRFDAAFRAYFLIAFPAVTRHLARLSRWEPDLLEELAQDALLRFFDRVGNGRRVASDWLRAALQRIQPLNLGAVHERQVRSWTHDTEAFRTSVMSYRPASGMDGHGNDFKATIRRLADRIPPLQSRGAHFLNAVCIASGWAPEPPASSIDFAECFAAAVSAGSPEVDHAEERLPGVAPFVSDTAMVVDSLPRIRVPTNGYLFEIALTIYLDECKKRGRHKRGGKGFSGTDEGSHEGSHPLQQLGSDFEAFPGDHAAIDQASTRCAADSSAYPCEPSVDPMRQFEDQEFLEKFHEYLRWPLDVATAEYEAARGFGSAKAEFKRVQSISNKFSRTISVLTLLGEGNSQEQVAARLELSRNQVKYIVELVQDAFEQFAQSPDRPAFHATQYGDRPHG